MISLHEQEPDFVMPPENPHNVGWKVMCDSNVGTDENRKLLATKDWFYSDLHRRLLNEHYSGALPEEIREEYEYYD